MSPVIEVLISPTGETKLETRGFNGPACQQATKALEAALGLELSETLTAEIHTAAQQQTDVAARADH